ncbi:hypothetical protein LINPERPRIM_LOCUS27040 [Linum perenne]
MKARVEISRDRRRHLLLRRRRRRGMRPRHELGSLRVEFERSRRRGGGGSGGSGDRAAAADLGDGGGSRRRWLGVLLHHGCGDQR